MQDISPVIIAVCGLATVCVGLFIVAGIVLVRFAGINILGPLMAVFTQGDLLDSVTGDSNSSEDLPRKAKRRPTTNLRAKGQSLDFDSTVSKYRKEGKTPSNKPPITPLTPPSRFGGQSSRDEEDRPTGSLRSRRNREGREPSEIYDDAEDDGLF